MNQPEPTTQPGVPPLKPPSKILTLILCSRNDNYMGNSLWRLQTTLNVTAQNAVAAGIADQVEVIVSDWGSERWLSQDLHLTPAAAAMTSFIQFSPTIATAAQKDSPFSEVHPLNAAARIAKGEFIGRIDQDTIVGERVFAKLPALTDDKAGFSNPAKFSLFFSQRRDIYTLLVSHSPPANRVAKLIQRFRRKFWISTSLSLDSDYYWITSVGIWLLHRDLWHEGRGFNENYIYRNAMEVEMANRLMQKYPMQNLGPYMDYAFFHLGHERVVEGDFGRKTQHGLVVEVTPTKQQPHAPKATTLDRKIAVNGPNWGMANYPINPIQVAPSGIEHTAIKANPSPEDLRYSLFEMTLDAAPILLPALIYWFKRVTLISLLTEGRGISAWWTAFSLRYHPRNLKRHMRAIKTKSAHKIE